MAETTPAIAITAPEGSSVEPINADLPTLFNHLLLPVNQIGAGSARPPSVRSVVETLSDDDDGVSIRAASVQESRGEHAPVHHPTTDLPSLEDTRPWEKEPVDRHFVKDVPSHIGRGPNADIWKLYEEKAKEVDSEALETWDKGIDVLLLFAALFSAVVTAFLAISLGTLSQDNSAATVAALTVLSSQINAANSNAVAQPSPFQAIGSFSPTSRALWVNALWILSLTISLYTAVLGMLVKQWLRTYTSHRSSVPQDRARQRHFRYMGLLSWQVPTIVDSLTLLLHLAVFLFLVGFPIYLWTLHAILALGMTIFWVIGILAYFFLSVAPLLWVSCPYNSALTRILAFLGAPIRYVSGKGKKVRDALRTEGTRETGGSRWTYSLRELLRQLRTVEAEGTWLHRRADAWINKKIDELDTSAFGWLQSRCQKQDEKDTVLCAFFGWQPHHEQWETVRITIEDAAKAGIFHLTRPGSGNEDYLGNKETWEMVSGPLIKLAVCVQFAPDLLKVYAPKWHEHPWAKSVFEMEDDTNKLLHLVLRLWCCDDDDLYTAYQKEAIEEFARVVRTTSCRPSQFGCWLLLEAAYMVLAGRADELDPKAQIDNLLIPAVNELLATSSNLPDFIVASAVRLWTASAGEHRPRTQSEGLLAPTMTDGLTASWTQILQQTLTPEIHLASRSYLVHNMSKEEMNVTEMAALVNQVTIAFRNAQLLYPQRRSSHAELTGMQQLDLRLAGSSMQVLAKMDEELSFAGIQLLVFDVETRNALLPPEGKEPRHNVIRICGEIFHLYDTFYDFMQAARREKDGQALILATLIIAAASRLDEFAWFIFNPFAERLVDLGWLDMVREFGYEDVIRNEPGLWKHVDRIIVRMAEHRVSDLEALAFLLEKIERDRWPEISPALHRLLPRHLELERGRRGHRRRRANHTDGPGTASIGDTVDGSGDPPSRDVPPSGPPSHWTRPRVSSTLEKGKDALTRVASRVADIPKRQFLAVRDGLRQQNAEGQPLFDLELGPVPRRSEDREEQDTEEHYHRNDQDDENKTHDGGSYEQKDPDAHVEMQQVRFGASEVIE